MLLCSVPAVPAPVTDPETVSCPGKPLTDYTDSAGVTFQVKATAPVTIKVPVTVTDPETVPVPITDYNDYTDYTDSADVTVQV